MESPNDQPDIGHDSRPSPETPTDPASGPTRRTLLAVGGLLASGQVALAASGEDRRHTALADARLKLAQKAIEAVRVSIDRGNISAASRDPIVIWSRRRMEARLALSTSKTARLAAIEEHVEEMKRLETILDQLSKVDEVEPLSIMDAQYRRLEAEDQLEQEKAKA